MCAADAQTQSRIPSSREVEGAVAGATALRKRSWHRSTYIGSAPRSCALYLTSAYMYASKGDWVRKALADLGYPAYLVPFMIVVKIVGPVAIVSRFNVALSDIAYAGVFYHLLLSGMAHIGVRS